MQYLSHLKHLIFVTKGKVGRCWNFFDSQKYPFTFCPFLISFFFFFFYRTLFLPYIFKSVSALEYMNL